MNKGQQRFFAEEEGEVDYEEKLNRVFRGAGKYYEEENHAKKITINLNPDYDAFCGEYKFDKFPGEEINYLHFGKGDLSAYLKRITKT